MNDVQSGYRIDMDKYAKQCEKYAKLMKKIKG